MVKRLSHGRNVQRIREAERRRIEQRRWRLIRERTKHDHREDRFCKD